MNTLLQVCLCALLGTIGTALQCEQCEGFGQKCEGPLETCPPDNKCGIFLIESPLGIRYKTIKKSCVKSSSCEGSFSMVNLGMSGMIAGRFVCCVGDECNRNTPTLPPIDTKPNGKRCLACDSSQLLVCENKIIQCTGDQDHCFDISGTSEIDKNIVMTVSLMGCANRILCAELNNHSIPFGGLSRISSTACTPASSRVNVPVSRVGRVILGQWGLFFQAITMLLLMFLFL